MMKFGYFESNMPISVQKCVSPYIYHKLMGHDVDEVLFKVRTSYFSPVRFAHLSGFLGYVSQIQ